MGETKPALLNFHSSFAEKTLLHVPGSFSLAAQEAKTISWGPCYRTVISIWAATCVCPRPLEAPQLRS